MLTQMRNASKGWLATILMGLLILAFGTWGITGVFLPSPTDAVAKVGDTKIKRGDFINEFTYTLNMQSRQSGQRVTPQDASRMGLDKMFLEQVITRTAFDVTADKLGLTAPDSVIRKENLEHPAFQGLTGEFDMDRYRETLYQLNLSEAAWEEQMRTDMARQQLIDSVTGGIKLPGGMVEALYKHNAERRKARYLILKPELAGTIPEPDDASLEKFRETHKARYTAPELRSFTYALLRPKDVMGQVEVSDEDVMHEYESRKEQYITPETRTVRQITYSTRDEALAALQKLRAGADFMTIAQEKGLSAEDVELGDLRKEQFLDPAVSEAAFALDSPGLTELVEGQFGFVIAEVTAITPSTTQTLDEVRESLKERLALDTATGKTEEVRGDFEDALAARSGTVEEIAEKLGLRTVTVQAVDQTGRTADGKRPEALPEEDDVLKAAFVNEEEEDLGLERLGSDGYFVVRIDEIVPSKVRPLDEIRDRVASDWKADQVHQRLEKLAKELAGRVNAGESIADIAAEYDVAAISTRPAVRRDGMGTDVFSQPVLKELFAAKPGEAVTGPVRNGESHLVVVLTDIQSPDISGAQARAAIDQGIDQFSQEYGMALADQYGQSLRNDLGVKKFDAVLAQAIADAR